MLRLMLDSYLGSTLLISLSILYFLVESISTFDVRLLQARKAGNLPPDYPMLPKWISVFHILGWLLLLSMVVADWKVGLAIWILMFVLKVLPVLETVGNLLLAPFKKLIDPGRRMR